MTFITDFRWQDLLDILILFVIFYRLILMVQGTRTSQMLVGLLLITTVFLISSRFDLYGVSALLTNLSRSLVVVIIVLFQADIRNALAQVGTRTLWRERHGENSNLLVQVLNVCQLFAKSRVGALIVFEKEMGLRSYASSGTNIDATISPPLLASVFHTNSPLHDGAVIINRLGRLQSAGCILPLTARLDLAEKLGTRHRAAMGLSEETDAVVVVVSEETGRILFAYKGEFFEENDTVSLRTRLRELLP